MEDKPYLRPCPFCGSQPELLDHRLVWSVNCDCGASVMGTRSPELEDEEQEARTDWAALERSAIDAWNRRTPPAISSWNPRTPSATVSSGAAE